ncbi:hypothetical protein DES53_106336 [Roseimicrobium gellanilyticum]|uniref:Uncharacterized protein n=1 Tax=Roseimicrobium gellanilyticum TaxID=748857 RepID=A0A366HIN4_9BACT|nr:hypothetical protein DES53_106336 [Roseimicrobium gellanilyticum]
MRHEALPHAAIVIWLLLVGLLPAFSAVVTALPAIGVERCKRTGKEGGNKNNKDGFHRDGWVDGSKRGGPENPARVITSIWMFF